MSRTEPLEPCLSDLVGLFSSLSANCRISHVTLVAGGEFPVPDMERLVLSHLEAIVPRLSQFEYDLPVGLSRAVMERVLPEAQALTSLTCRIHPEDSLDRFLSSDAFFSLRELTFDVPSHSSHPRKAVFVSMPLSSATMDHLSLALRRTGSLRTVCFSTTAEDGARLLEVCLANHRLVRIEFHAARLPERVTANLMGIFCEACLDYQGPGLALTCVSNETEHEGRTFVDVLVEFPGLLRSLSLVESGKSVEVDESSTPELIEALRHLRCAVRNLALRCDAKGLADNGSELVSAISACASLRALCILSRSAILPRALLREACFLKELRWGVSLSPPFEEADWTPADRATLLDEIVRNEIVESLGFPDELLMDAMVEVGLRNAGLCLGRCRLMWLSWVEDLVTTTTIFDAVVAYNVLVMAELDWNEDERIIFLEEKRDKISKQTQLEIC